MPVHYIFYCGGMQSFKIDWPKWTTHSSDFIFFSDFICIKYNFRCCWNFIREYTFKKEQKIKCEQIKLCQMIRNFIYFVLCFSWFFFSIVMSEKKCIRQSGKCKHERKTLLNKREANIDILRNTIQHNWFRFSIFINAINIYIL